MKIIKSELLITVFLWINIIYSLIINPSLDITFLLGILGLTIVSTLYFAKKSVNIIILLFLLGFSIFNLISFNIAFSTNFMGLINIINFFLFVFLVYKKRKFLSSLNEKWFGTSKEDYVEKRLSEITFFERRFADLSKDEIIKKLNNKDLAETAQIALREILKKKS